MKANVPEKIWIDTKTDLPKLSGHIDKNSVEYIRKDTFIEKAVEWLEVHLYDYWSQRITDYRDFTDEFRKYMKGE